MVDSKNILLDQMDFKSIRGRRDVALFKSSITVPFNGWCLEGRGLVARVGRERIESQHFLQVKKEHAYRLAKEFKDGLIEKEDLILVSGIKDFFYRPKSAARDGSLAYDRKGLLILDFDKKILSYGDINDMFLELGMYLDYPVCVSPNNKIKVLIPILVRAGAPWNHETRLNCCRVFLQHYLPPGLDEEYFKVLDKTQASLNVFFANQNILDNLFDNTTQVPILILSPTSELQAKPPVDRTRWCCIKPDQELTNLIVDRILSKAPFNKQVAPSLYPQKLIEIKENPKTQQWLKKYLSYAEERMGKMKQEILLGEQQQVGAVVYGKGFFTRLSDYLIILRILLSQPNLDDQRSIKFLYEVLLGKGIEWKFSYIHLLLKELTSLGFLLKTQTAQRHKNCNHYQLIGGLEILYEKKIQIIREEPDLPEDIEEGEYYTELWKNVSKFASPDLYLEWAMGLPSFQVKRGKSRARVVKDRIRKVVGAWNRSLQLDIENDRLMGKEQVFLKVQHNEILRVAVAA